jgi:aryl-alcohol dehydrogenase-like predicted oxidoreductase/predicted kinase
MRLSTNDDRDERRSLETIAAAAAAGITIFDTAHAYGRGRDEVGHNERLLARALRAAGGGADRAARIVTKGGMSRASGGWTPDGRAKRIRADCEGGLQALDGLPIDLYLLHAPDPRTPWSTSARALARLVDDGLVRRVGLSNVNRHQLDVALDVAPIAAVQVALSPFDDRAVRGGVVERCDELGLAVLAHSPLGGPRRVARLLRNETLAAIAAGRDTMAAEVALAWVLSRSPNVVAIPGATRPASARSAAHAAALRLHPRELDAIGTSFGRRAPVAAAPSVVRGDAEVILVMGIPGAGKSAIAAGYVARGALRLNRDERGGSLGELADVLETELAAGRRTVVLDNTYLTRASRRDVIEVARRRGARTTCVWLDIPLAQAQRNLVERLLERFGHLPMPEEIRAVSRREPWVMPPTSQMRTVRELEPPSEDESFDALQHLTFARRPLPGRSRAGVFAAAAALDHEGWRDALARADPAAPHLVFDWAPGAGAEALDERVRRIQGEVSGPVDTALCPHPGGPPICWCRPPLPGLPLAFARERGVDPDRSILIGAGPAHRTLATTLGAVYVGL